eukprot:764116-Hanusia_phi.AAC.3
MGSGAGRGEEMSMGGRGGEERRFGAKKGRRVQGRKGNVQKGEEINVGLEIKGQDRTGQDRTGQDRTGQDRTGHQWADGCIAVGAEL